MSTTELSSLAVPNQPRTHVPSNGATILFVDDDQDLLDGLRIVLRRKIKGCQLLFARGAEQAIELLADNPVNLVVADLKMPGMTGIELLEVVRERHPQTVRILLTGESGLDFSARGMEVAHQWLTKPCDCDELAGALSRAIGHLQTGLGSDVEACRALADGGPLPSPPRLYAELQQLLADDEVAVDDVVERVATDPAVSAKLLQLANSALLSCEPVRDIKTAVSRIGLDTLSKLALSVELTRMFEHSDRLPGFTTESFSRYCATSSRLATELANPDQAAKASIGAVLAPVGLLVEAARLPDRLAKAYRLAEDNDRPLVEVERELYGFAHPDLAAQLLSVWGLPTELVSLVSSAHDQLELGSGPPFDADDAVRAALLLAVHLDGQPTGRPHHDRADPETIEVLSDWVAAAPSPEGETS